eukprot:4281970-Lingulodinium_polyedra.AAC.1
MKDKLFRQTVRGCKHCWLRGRRGSALARGHWKVLAEQVRTATSPELGARLSRLPEHERDEVMSMFDRMRLRSFEELLAKFSYWDCLPH